MLSDPHYLNQQYRLSEIPHHYGKNVHLLSHPYLFTMLAKLCDEATHQPLVNQLLESIYGEMLRMVASAEFPQVEATLSTRMRSMHPQARFQAKIIDPNTKAVSVNLARAGTVPSQICYNALNYLLNPSGVRQDHISINRKVDEHEHVIGTNLGGLKIGGPVDGAFVIIPDPMGATGSTIQTALEIYRQHGKAARYIAVHLIVTPEYLKTVSREFPELKVYAIRLDRGLSPQNALGALPGAQWDEERGLNDRQYIVPGGGGLGEVINNAYV
ncbi:uracil phosphoribosyltransferase [bacterium]|nr:uracil phosphoribosyltransferase [bacterium]